MIFPAPVLTERKNYKTWTLYEKLPEGTEEGTEVVDKSGRKFTFTGNRTDWHPRK